MTTNIISLLSLPYRRIPVVTVKNIKLSYSINQFGCLFPPYPSAPAVLFFKSPLEDLINLITDCGGTRLWGCFSEDMASHRLNPK